MTADQWEGIYAREKERDGEVEAVRTLFRGLMRELASRGEKGFAPGQAFAEVEAIYHYVGARHDFKPDGLRTILRKFHPHAEAFIDAADARPYDAGAEL